MLTTNRPDPWELVSSPSDHGKAPGLTGLGQEWAGSFPGDCCSASWANWRLSEVQSAIGRVQLGKLPVWLEMRRRNAGILAAGLRDVAGLRVPLAPVNVDPAWYRFYAFLIPDRLQPGWNRDLIVAAVRAEGVPCDVGACPDVMLEKAFARQPRKEHPVARELGETSLAFPVHPTLSIDEMDAVVQAVTKVMTVAAR